jgi:hypothetical protein
MQTSDEQSARVDDAPGGSGTPVRVQAAHAAVVVIRHLIPVAMVVFLKGSASQFLLLSIFNIAFTVACIGGIGTAVSAAKRKSGRARGEGATAVTIGAVVVVTLILTVTLGWWIVPIAAQEGDRVLTGSLGLSAVAIVVAALPSLRFHFADDMNSSLTESERMTRDRSNAGLLLLCGVLIFFMANISLVVTMIGTVVLFIVADLRPDLIRASFLKRQRPKR